MADKKAPRQEREAAKAKGAKKDAPEPESARKFAEPPKKSAAADNDDLADRGVSDKKKAPAPTAVYAQPPTDTPAKRPDAGKEAPRPETKVEPVRERAKLDPSKDLGGDAEVSDQAAGSTKAEKPRAADPPPPTSPTPSPTANTQGGRAAPAALAATGGAGAGEASAAMDEQTPALGAIAVVQSPDGPKRFDFGARGSFVKLRPGTTMSVTLYVPARYSAALVALDAQGNLRVLSPIKTSPTAQRIAVNVPGPDKRTTIIALFSRPAFALEGIGLDTDEERRAAFLAPISFSGTELRIRLAPE
jgi:hypothetical protein